jgi:hypothetical protein
MRWLMWGAARIARLIARLSTLVSRLDIAGFVDPAAGVPLAHTGRDWGS